MPEASPVPGISFAKDVTFLHFKDPSLRAAFDAFRLSEVSVTFFTAMLSVATIIQVVSLTVASQASNRVILPVRQARLVLMLPIWLYLYQIKYHTSMNSYAQRLLGKKRMFGDIAVMCCVLSLAITLVGRCVIGACLTGEDRSNCNHEASLHEMPQDAVLSLILSLLGVQALMKPRWKAMAAAWFIAMSSVIAASLLVHAAFTPIVPLICILTSLILYETERNALAAYIAMLNMEQSLRTQLQAENEKRVMEMKSVEMQHLMGNVAHDLKTPMQSFLLELEYVQQILKAPVKQSERETTFSAKSMSGVMDSVQNLLDTVTFMFMVINRTVEFTKHASGLTLNPTLHTIALHDTIKWALDICRSKTLDNIELTLESLPNDVCDRVISDKQWLIENVLCLVSNAMKFTMRGSIDVRCVLHTEADEPDMLLIEVEDTGIGIPEDRRSAMFQPFQQAMSMAGGTGLGLYSLSLRVKALGGKCGMRDRSDGAQGCCFWFMIPYRPDPGDGETPNTSRSIDTHLSESLSAPDPSAIQPLHSLLVVDDSVTIRKTISRMLCAEGLAVDMAENGQMALEMMATTQYDLVLMDLQMPVMDGLEAVRRFRQMEHATDSGHQLILAISAFGDDPYIAQALNAGMDGFIEKPFNLKLFFEKCKQHHLVKSSEIRT